MSQPPRQAPHPKLPTPPRARVPVARGYGRDALARVIDALDRAHIEHEIAEDLGGESPGSWQVVVPIGSAPRAIALLAALAADAAPATVRRADENPGPLFVGASDSIVRALLMALCFGLAIWLALR